MTYSILTDTDFFRAAQNGNTDEIIALYSEFIGKVIEVCSRTNDRTTAFATLLYTEIELKRMGDNEVVAKALEFITEMQKMVDHLRELELLMTSSLVGQKALPVSLNWHTD